MVSTSFKLLTKLPSMFSSMESSFLISNGPPHKVRVSSIGKIFLVDSNKVYLGHTEMHKSVQIQQICITDLYDECLHLIFERLDAKMDRESLGLTCHHFLDIQSSRCKRLDLGTLPWFTYSPGTLNIDSSKLDKLLTRFTQLESLSLRRCINVSDSGLSRLQNCGSKLHTLYLDDLFKVTDKGISYIASGCPLLSVISLSRCAISDKGLKTLTESCKRLKEVDIAGCNKITDTGIWSLNQNCRRLKTLNISHCRKIRGVSFQGCSPTLVSLLAYNCMFSIEGFTEILSCSGLEYLNFASIKCIGGNGLAVFGLGFAANLKILDFHSCDFVTNDVIISVSKGCPLLEEWNLSFCRNISASGYAPIGWFCKNLERIHLIGCYSFNDGALQALGSGCRRLSVIRLKGCAGVSPIGKAFFKRYRQDVTIIEKEARNIVPRWAFAEWP